MHSGQQVAFQPPSVVDTTGAGDAFTAGLVAPLGRRAPGAASALLPPVVLWSVAGPVALILSPRTLRLKPFLEE